MRGIGVQSFEVGEGVVNLAAGGRAGPRGGCRPAPLEIRVGPVSPDVMRYERVAT